MDFYVLTVYYMQYMNLMYMYCYIVVHETPVLFYAMI